MNSDKKFEDMNIVYRFYKECKEIDAVNWYNLIKNKNLGIETTVMTSDLLDEFIVTDEKKWLLCKLKYGF
jgi:hypothetical protein